MSYALHLLTPGIARRGQVLRQLIEVANVSWFQTPGTVLQNFPGHRALEKGLHSGHQKGIPSLGQFPHQTQTAVFPLVGGGGGVVKGKGAWSQNRDGFSCQGGKILSQPLSLAFISADEDHRPLGAQSHSRSQVDPVNRCGAGQGDGAAPTLQTGQEFLKFRQSI